MRARAKTRPAPRGAATLDALAFGILAAGAVAIPLLVSPSGHDAFRIPKLLLLQGEGLLLFALAFASRLFGARNWTAEPSFRVPFAVAIAAVGWTGVTVIASVDPVMSVSSLFTALAAALVFLWSARLATRPAILAILFTAPVVIALVALLQTNDAWNRAIVRGLLGEVAEEWLPRLSPISLLGNRNDVSGYLVGSALCAIALLLAARSPRLRLVAGATAIVLAAGIAASNTITAIIAFAVSAFVLGAMRSWRLAVAAFVILALAASAAIAVYPPLRERSVVLAERFEAGQWDKFLTGRMAAFLAAWEMSARDPLTGVGPGCFKREYFERKIAAAERHPSLLPGGGSAEMFEDAHNNHLQFAAETGVPGYLLFLAGLALVARGSFRRHREAGAEEYDWRRELARLVSLPFAISLLVLSLGQSPLQLAATIGSCALIAGICLRWSTDA